MTKKIFFKRHYFLKLQKQFPEKWGAHAPPSPPVPMALLYSPTLRCCTNIVMAKVPGASLYGSSARHDTYSCQRQAKAFRFILSLSCLPTGVSLFTNIG